MNIYRSNQEQLIKGTNTYFQRYLYKRIKWSHRLIGITGASGVGKTTLLLQRIKMAFGDSTAALYLPLDNIWFRQDTLTEVIEDFYSGGGRYLFLDNVDQYVGWIREVEEMIKIHPDLSVVFAASSVFPLKKIQRMGNGSVAHYTLHTLSFREYLLYENILELKPFSLDEILVNHAAIGKEIASSVNIIQWFRNYLEHGCYPFYWEDPDAFPFRLQRLVNDSIDKDWPVVRVRDINASDNLKRLILRLVSLSSLSLKVSEWVAATRLEREKLRMYIQAYVEMGLLRCLPLAESPLQNRIQKIYAANTNLLRALSRTENERMQVGETFFVDQLANSGKVEWLANHEFSVNDHYLFQVGDPLMNYDRIKNRENAYTAVYGLPRSVGNKMPIWLLGLCY